MRLATTDVHTASDRQVGTTESLLESSRDQAVDSVLPATVATTEATKEDTELLLQFHFWASFDSPPPVSPKSSGAEIIFRFKSRVFARLASATLCCIAPKAPNQKALRMGFLLVSALLTTSSIALLASALLRPSGLNNRALAAHHKRSAAVYCCLDASSDGRNLTFFNPELDCGPNGLKAFNSLLYRTGPNLKRFFAVGGQHAMYAHLNRALSSADSREQFIEAVLSWLQVPYLRSSGLVIHITYPERLSKQNTLNYFILELASKIRSRSLVVTLPLSSEKEAKYRLPLAYKKVDILIKMSHRFGNPAIGNCPNPIKGLQTHSLQKTIRETKSFYWKNWMSSLKSKFLFTVSLAGYAYWVKNGSLSGMTRDRVQKYKLSAYSDICIKVHDINWNHKYIRETGCLTAWSGRTYFSSLSPKSFKFIEDRKNIRGLAVFDIERDDFRGVCGSPYPMLRAIRDNLKKSL
ncbi:hypothetical protein HPB47_007204 [Ixodes persulcatus]|uniref:Uncharacterized protein n=1 Tax=Ixodes persulcatus TaxID=34615 RepID=A0AC60P7Z4_IXOPE|nr:hypothetical protein HPB47_007204 [Ixodes persulcatus]